MDTGSVLFVLDVGNRMSVRDIVKLKEGDFVVCFASCTTFPQLFSKINGMTKIKHNPVDRIAFQ